MRSKLVGQLQPTDEGLLIIGSTERSMTIANLPGYLYAFNLDPNAGRRVEWRVPLDGEALGAAAIDNTTNTAYGRHYSGNPLRH